MGRELQKEEELIRLSQKMMEDNEFRLKSTIEASENEIRDIAEFFTGKIREAENELAAVSELTVSPLSSTLLRCLQIRKKSRQALESNEIDKVNIEADVDDEQLKLKLEYEHEKKDLVRSSVPFRF